MGTLQRSVRSKMSSNSSKANNTYDITDFYHVPYAIEIIIITLSLPAWTFQKLTEVYCEKLVAGHIDIPIIVNIVLPLEVTDRFVYIRNLPVTWCYFDRQNYCLHIKVIMKKFCINDFIYFYFPRRRCERKRSPILWFIQQPLR